MAIKGKVREKIRFSITIRFLVEVRRMKLLVGLAFILIFLSLGSALLYMMKDKGRSNRTVKALAFRVGFSISLFLLILLANHFGLVQPTGIR